MGWGKGYQNIHSAPPRDNRVPVRLCRANNMLCKLLWSRSESFFLRLLLPVLFSDAFGQACVWSKQTTHKMLIEQAWAITLQGEHLSSKGVKWFVVLSVASCTSLPPQHHCHRVYLPFWWRALRFNISGMIQQSINTSWFCGCLTANNVQLYTCTDISMLSIREKHKITNKQTKKKLIFKCDYVGCGAIVRCNALRSSEQLTGAALRAKRLNLSSGWCYSGTGLSYYRPTLPMYRFDNKLFTSIHCLAMIESVWLLLLLLLLCLSVVVIGNKRRSE